MGGNAVSLLELAAIASEQWGLVTTAQAASIGVPSKATARWAKEGALVRVTRGVYKVAGSPYDPLDDLRAAWLMLDPKRTAAERTATEPIDAVVSHRSAARIHELGDLDADVYDFTVQGRKQPRRPDVRIHSRSHQLNRDSWGMVSGLPVTSVLATIVDLAAAQTDGGHLAGVVRDAIATAEVDIDRLSTALRPYAHRYGVPLGDGDALIRRFLSEAGLPKTTEKAAEFARETRLPDQIGELSPSDLDLLRRAMEVSGDPATRRALDLLSSPETQRNLAQALDALRKAGR
jgi:predicted transcriptional regulator of viral defense system